MSVQILLQGRILGTESFLLTGDPSEHALAGRCHWTALLSEIIPRALIAELGLSKILLGSSGADQFLVVLPIEFRAQAEEFLSAAAADASARSCGSIDLSWAITENLGDWTVVRKRLNEEMARKLGAPLAKGWPITIAPDSSSLILDEEYFSSLGVGLRDASAVGWSPETPAKISLGEGKHTWTIGSGPAATADAIPFARHTALDEEGHQAASLDLVAKRSQGHAAWGVLRGDVDNFGIRLRRAQTIEEHVQVSVLYKQFFAGELEVICSLGEFWRKVTLLYSGGDDFAVYGSWDALIAFARELQRLFHRFAAENLKEFPGPEGKTVTMALSLAHDAESLASVYARAGRKLELAKSSDKDCFHLLGRTLEWKQLADAAETRDDLARMVTEFGVPAQYIQELCGMYRETRRVALPGEQIGRRYARPWRFHRRLNRILGTQRSREFQKARTSLIADLVGKNPANLKLRPSGRVALEWARLGTEGMTGSEGMNES